MYTTNCEVCEKMPKARANINVYSSTPCSGLILEDQMICIRRTARYVIQIKANSRRCQKHERTLTYTAVREFPVQFLKTKKLYRMMMIPGTQPHDYDRSHMMWYVYDNLRGMWYQIKQKQQKMPKARANINVYSSTRCSRLILEHEMTCIPRTARYVIRIKANSRRCQKHERTSTYTAVREFPV